MVSSTALANFAGNRATASNSSGLSTFDVDAHRFFHRISSAEKRPFTEEQEQTEELRRESKRRCISFAHDSDVSDDDEVLYTPSGSAMEHSEPVNIPSWTQYAADFSFGSSTESPFTFSTATSSPWLKPSISASQVVACGQQLRDYYDASMGVNPEQLLIAHPPSPIIVEDDEFESVDEDQPRSFIPYRWPLTSPRMLWSPPSEKEDEEDDFIMMEGHNVELDVETVAEPECDFVFLSKEEAPEDLWDLLLDDVL